MLGIVVLVMDWPMTIGTPFLAIGAACTAIGGVNRDKWQRTLPPNEAK